MLSESARAEVLVWRFCCCFGGTDDDEDTPAAGRGALLGNDDGPELSRVLMALLRAVAFLLLLLLDMLDVENREEQAKKAEGAGCCNEGEVALQHRLMEQAMRPYSMSYFQRAKQSIHNIVKKPPRMAYRHRIAKQTTDVYWLNLLGLLQ
jgi:hypothetical protein